MFDDFVGDIFVYSSFFGSKNLRLLRSLLLDRESASLQLLLKDIRTGEVLNVSIVDDDCTQVASAIAAVEMTQEPNCSGVSSPPMTSSAVCGEYLMTMALAMLLLVAAACLL
jgi:hypothetical protein